MTFPFDGLITLNMRWACGCWAASRHVVERGGQTITAKCDLVRELPVYQLPFFGVLLDKGYLGEGSRFVRLEGRTG